MKAKWLLSVALAALLLVLTWVLLDVPCLRARPLEATGLRKARAAGGETFTVSDSGDSPDSSPGNCVCATATGKCTLRAAMQEANACAGPQTIRFGGPWAITPTSALPALTDNGTVIDGSDWWAVGSGHGGLPMVWLDGQGGLFHGVAITASDCAVYGLAIMRFSGYGVFLHSGAQHNHIGGPGHRRVVISANGLNGVRIGKIGDPVPPTDNVVENCYIGTDPEGLTGSGPTLNWRNGWHGISIWHGGGNVISGCLIANNGWSGVAVDYAAKDIIQYNRIGMNLLGQPLGNGFYGVHVAHGATPVVLSNTLAYNRRGVHVEGGSAPWIIGNTIHNHNASRTDLTLPGYGGGILCYDQSFEHSTPVIMGNLITNNVAYTGSTGSGYGGGIALWYCDGSQIERNTIVSNTASTASAGSGGGLHIKGDGVTVTLNTILSNTASGTTNGYGGGIALYLSDALIAGNLIRGNAGSLGGAYSWGALHLLYSNATVDANQILGNRGTSGADVAVENSTRFTLTNNIIAGNTYRGVGVWASEATHGVLAHNTIVSHTYAGLYAWKHAVLTLTNNIIAGNPYGIQADPAGSTSNTVTADYTLFYANMADKSGGTILSTHEITGQDPRFRAPAAWDCHLEAGSPAINAGLPVPWVTSDMDGDTRPLGSGYDIGADEFVSRLCLPLVLRKHAQIPVEIDEGDVR